MNSFDTQPWVPLYCSFLLLFSKFSWKEVILFFSFLVLVIAFNFLSIGELAVFIRGLLAWCVLFFGFALFMNFRGSMGGVVKLANKVYLGVAVLQFFFPNIVSFLVENRTSIGRGVTSLAPEPTFFGLVLVVFVIYFLGVNKSYFWATLNALFIVFFAKSSTGILVLVCVILIFTFRESHKKFILAMFISMVGLYLIYVIDFGRMTTLLRGVMNISSLIETDYSVRIRLADIVMLPHMLTHNFFMPIAFDQVSSIRMMVSLDAFDGLFFYSSVLNKTNSYIGFFLLTGGVGTVALLCVLFIYCRQKYTFIAALILATFSLPPATIFIPFLLASSFRRQNVQ